MTEEQRCQAACRGQWIKTVKENRVDGLEGDQWSGWRVTVVERDGAKAVMEPSGAEKAMAEGVWPDKKRGRRPFRRGFRSSVVVVR